MTSLRALASRRRFRLCTAFGLRGQGPARRAPRARPAAARTGRHDAARRDDGQRRHDGQRGHDGRRRHDGTAEQRGRRDDGRRPGSAGTTGAPARPAPRGRAGSAGTTGSAGTGGTAGAAAARRGGPAWHRGRRRARRHGGRRHGGAGGRGGTGGRRRAAAVGGAARLASATTSSPEPSACAHRMGQLHRLRRTDRARTARRSLSSTRTGAQRYEVGARSRRSSSPAQLRATLPTGTPRSTFAPVYVRPRSAAVGTRLQATTTRPDRHRKTPARSGRQTVRVRLEHWDRSARTAIPATTGPKRPSPDSSDREHAGTASRSRSLPNRPQHTVYGWVDGTLVHCRSLRRPTHEWEHGALPVELDDRQVRSSSSSAGELQRRRHRSSGSTTSPSASPHRLQLRRLSRSAHQPAAEHRSPGGRRTRTARGLVVPSLPAH